MRSWPLKSIAVAVLLATSVCVEAAAEVLGATPEGAPASPRVVSGAAARDANGVRGRIHVVSRGDTLWDIASTYHRTPWVWPSIWREHREIATPHRLPPGAHLWISETAMLTVTPE